MPICMNYEILTISGLRALILGGQLNENYLFMKSLKFLFINETKWIAIKLLTKFVFIIIISKFKIIIIIIMQQCMHRYNTRVSSKYTFGY